jgi:hypothetical protein
MRRASSIEAATRGFTRCRPYSRGARFAVARRCIRPITARRAVAWLRCIGSSTKKGASTRTALRFPAGNPLPAGFATSRLTRASRYDFRSPGLWAISASMANAFKHSPHMPTWTSPILRSCVRRRRAPTHPQGADIRRFPRPSDMPIAPQSPGPPWQRLAWIRTAAAQEPLSGRAQPEILRNRPHCAGQSSHSDFCTSGRAASEGEPAPVFE